MRTEGLVKSWNDDRGFGFIEPIHGGQEIFVHIKAFPPRAGRPRVGQYVCFEIEQNRRERNAPRMWSSSELYAAARHEDSTPHRIGEPFPCLRFPPSSFYTALSPFFGVCQIWWLVPISC